MTTMYFKSTSDEPAIAIKAYQESIKHYSSQFNPLEAEFNATAIFSYDVHGMRFYDLAFNDYQNLPDKDLWTKPDPKYKNACRIRSSVRGKENMARLNELKQRYESLLPKDIEKPCRHEFFDSIGVSWGDLIFCGLDFFVHNDEVYLATSMNLTKNVVEITGSTFDAAKKAHNQKSE